MAGSPKRLAVGPAFLMLRNIISTAVSTREVRRSGYAAAMLVRGASGFDSAKWPTSALRIASRLLDRPRCYPSSPSRIGLKMRSFFQELINPLFSLE